MSPKTALRVRKVAAFYAEAKDRRWVNQLRLPQVDGSREESRVDQRSPFSRVGFCNGPERVPNGLKIWGPPPLVHGLDGFLNEYVTRYH